MKTIYLKLGVTTLAIVLFVLNIKFHFDNIGLGLIFIALLPWLSSFLQAAELPGGWKFEFKQVKQEQEKQKEDIARLKFLIEGYVSRDELHHLHKLMLADPFLVKVDGTTKFFVSELRRLRSLGLIEGYPNKGIRSLFDNNGGGDVKDHFHLTERGRAYLQLRDYENAD